MKVRGSVSVVKALEDEGIRFTFGIPGTHNTELYDALADSTQVEPVLVTDEQCASFMADAVSRTSDTIGVLNLVPGAGVTHALSGIAEAFMDNVPLLVLCCGMRTDTGKSFQLHDINQVALLRPVCKEVFHLATADEIYPGVRKAVRIARAGPPGPVAVEIPVNLYLLTTEIPGFEYTAPTDAPAAPKPDELTMAADLLNTARHPAIYVGNGAQNAPSLVCELAQKLFAPVTTTIQGKGVFPESHELFLWNGFGNSAPSFVGKIMDRCDCLLAIGCRFGEVATASYGIDPPQNMIHVDIAPEVLNANYPAKLPIVADAPTFLKALTPLVKQREKDPDLIEAIAAGHRHMSRKWQDRKSKNRVTPFHLFKTLQKVADADAIFTTDSGNGTFLSMEMMRIEKPGRFIGPIDYSCMGYAVPAAIGAKLCHPQTDVIALAGDGALLMTGLELLSTASLRIAPVVFVLRDGTLSQISQLQSFTYSRDTCTLLPDYSTQAFARTVNCEYFSMASDAEVENVALQALHTARDGQPVMVEVNIDYSVKTWFTKGVLKTNFLRLPWSERVRMAIRSGHRRMARLAGRPN